MELETAFYILAIVYMSLMLILFIALLAAVLLIKAKIDRLHHLVDTKVAAVKNLAAKASVGARALKYFVKQ